MIQINAKIILEEVWRIVGTNILLDHNIIIWSLLAEDKVWSVFATISQNFILLKNYRRIIIFTILSSMLIHTYI